MVKSGLVEENRKRVAIVQGAKGEVNLQMETQETKTGVDEIAWLRKAQNEYRRKTRKSRETFSDAKRIMPGGHSHNARSFEPYPFYAKRARGKYIWDIDGNRYTDYWMGHTSLILGHSPRPVVDAIEKQAGNGLLFGSPNKFAYELAQLVNKTVPCAESIRFCTTGAEATMYAVRLARSFTRKKIIVKMTGGWHGYNSALTVGVSAPYNVPESSGLIPEEEKYARLAEFNDIEATRAVLAECADQLAGVIVEPVMGAGGVLAANKEYLKFLREECTRLGCPLILDEIITGFRLSLGGAQEHYGITPDLCTLGKILGGGLPVSAVAGRKEILSLADTTGKSKAERCWIGGGTFSENALCMNAGIATLKHLIKNKSTLYPQISSLGDEIRESVDETFGEFGIRTKTTGLGSLFVTHFLSDGQEDIVGPRDVNASNRELESRYYFSMISRYGIYFIPGHIGAISTEHSQADVTRFLVATTSIAKEIAAGKKK